MREKNLNEIIAFQRLQISEMKDSIIRWKWLSFWLITVDSAIFFAGITAAILCKLFG